MTRHGEKLADLTIDEITEKLSEESDGKAIKRLVAVREYLAGNTPAEIAAKYGWSEQTIYSWFDRIESRGLEGALYDESPPGRPPSLSATEVEQFQRAVETTPTDVGFDAPEWSSALAQEYLRREFGQEFSRRHVRRLLDEAGHSG